MAESRLNTDFAIPPGETLKEVLSERQISQTELARRMGRPLKTINEIIKGKATITPDTALQLERVLRIPASFWANLDRYFQDDRARLEERTALKAEQGWLPKFPIRDMVAYGLIDSSRDKSQQLLAILQFFGVASPAAWRAEWSRASTQFRKPAIFASSPEAIATWLRWGEVTAERIPTKPYNADDFRKAVAEIRSLTRKPLSEFAASIQTRCAVAGVAVCYIPELRGTHVSAASRWLTPGKALIQLSFRYRYDDQFWFSFFHECAHVLLHPRRDVFLENLNVVAKVVDRREEEADDFARDQLVPSGMIESLIGEGTLDCGKIARFAESLNIAPGIVVGRLQRDGKLPRDQCNGLKRRLPWTRSLIGGRFPRG
jgi:addiction module HigA family antidote